MSAGRAEGYWKEMSLKAEKNIIKEILDLFVKAIIFKKQRISLWNELNIYLHFKL